MLRNAIVVLSAVAAPAAVFAAVHIGNWYEQPSPDLSGREEILHDVVALNDFDAVAVGYHWAFLGGLVEFRAHVIRWDGSAWYPITAPNIPGTLSIRLHGIDALGLDDFWVVGQTRNSGSSSRGFASHWDGVQWTHAELPNPGPTGSHLADVAAVAPDNVWAVGQSNHFDHGSQAMVLHFNGRSWTQVPVTGLEFCQRDAALTSVAQRGRDHILVAGYCRTGSNMNQGFLLRRTPDGWQREIGPDNLAGRTELMAVTFTNRNLAWAAGARHTDLADRPVIFQWDGAAWVEQAIPEEIEGQITSLAAPSRNRVWAAGLGYSSQPPFAGRFILRRTGAGSGWVEEPAGDFGSFNGIDGTAAGHLWAVGQNIDRSLISKREVR